MRKLLVIAALVVATVFVSPAAALAQTRGYVAEVGSGQVSQGTVGPGGTVEFCGDGFAPGSTVTVADEGVVIATGTADGSGALCVTVTLTGAGTHVLTMTGLTEAGNPRTVTAAVRVLAATAAAPVRSSSGSGSGSGNLARTGAEGTATQVWAGIGLLGLGGGLVALTVSRRRTPAGVA